MILFRKANMEKYIPENLRQQCYYDWVRVRRCATNKIGDAFSSHLNVSRTIEDVQPGDEEMIERYEAYVNRKMQIIKKELKLESEEGEEGGEEEEEAAEEGGETEGASEGGASEEVSEGSVEGGSEEGASTEQTEGAAAENSDDKENLAISENADE
jgi:hypothetical protein